MGILKAEMAEVAKDYGDDRRTEIIPDQDDFSVEDLIAEEDMVITISHSGYIKRIPVSTYRKQRRGGRGLTGATAKEDDWIEHLFIASTHDYVMFFSDKGQVYWLKVHEIPQGGRAARGKPVVQCIAIRPDERIAALVPVQEFVDDQVAAVRDPERHRQEDACCRPTATCAPTASTRSTSKRATS